jgi:hypothetical protein
MRTRWLGLVTIWIGPFVYFAMGAAFAQSAQTYKVRLTTVPLDASMMATVAGAGALTATLTGRQLTISGNFAGLHSPATDAHIHRGPRGIRGPAILEVQVRKQVPGTLRTDRYGGEIRDSIELTPEQVEDLKNGRLYVQIDSQGAPDGNLWGWLLR